MSKDISTILAGWDFNPDELQVRMITGDDGRERIQMRVDLGVLQMELAGRPDGQKPHGFDSFLDYYEAREKSTVAAGKEFALDHRACGNLMREGLQYYHRYLSAFHLQKYDLVSRDTEHNLRLFAFVVQHASRQRDKIEFDQYRPYVHMMRARAIALEALAQGDFSRALNEIDEGISHIRGFLLEYHQEDHENDSRNSTSWSAGGARSSKRDPPTRSIASNSSSSWPFPSRITRRPPACATRSSSSRVLQSKRAADPDRQVATADAWQQTATSMES